VNKLLTLNRVYWFSAAHRLHAPDLSERDNKAVFDKCNNPMGHGHDYKLEVALLGIADPETGMLISLDRFDSIVTSVLHTMDHRHLDKEVEHFKQHTSTGENIIVYIWQALEQHLPKGMLFQLKMWETKNNYFEYISGRRKDEDNRAIGN
jgi:6-pyruvoyltetrahydropterin/6-carboxytetrahydropterin synthase